MLNYYVDGEARKPAGVQQSDPGWVGNWWAGYLVFALLGGAFCWTLALFPRKLASTVRSERACPTSPSTAGAPGAPHLSLVRQMLALTRNAPVQLLVLASTSESFFLSAAVLYLAKYVSSVFSLEDSRASLLVGVAIVPGVGIGTFAGGWFGQRKLRTPRAALLFLVAVAAINLGLVGMFAVHCGDVALAPGTMHSPLPALCGAPAAANCSCATWPFNPVCGADSLVYFSPCFAACNSTLPGSSSHLLGCACVTGTVATARSGMCSTSCTGAMGLFFAVLLVAMFFAFVTSSPFVSVFVELATPQLSAAAMAYQSVVTRLLGAIPGPLVLGAMIDSSCLLRESKCGRTGSCYLYRSRDIRRQFIILGVATHVLTLCLYTLAWLAGRRAAPHTVVWGGDADDADADAMQQQRLLS